MANRVPRALPARRLFRGTDESEPRRRC